MKKILFRVISYVLDLLLVSVIALGFSMISFFNPNRNELERLYEVYNKNVTEIQAININLGKYLEDSVITNREYVEIVEQYPNFFYIFDNYTIDEDLKNKEISEIKTKVEEKSRNLVNGTGVKINKLKTPQIIISLVVYVLYFGVLQFFMNGQTVFKRIFRLKVVDNKNKNKKVSLWKYIIRALLVTEILLALVDTLFVFTLKQTSYITASYWLDNFKYLYEMGFLVAMVIRDDQRSIHDVILNTRIIRYDKDKNEIEEKLFDDEEEVKVSSKKEYVKAEKVND